MTSKAQSGEVYVEVNGEAAAEGGGAVQPAALLALPVPVAISVGKVKATIAQLMSIKPGAILSLDAKIDDPVELLVGERVIARGRLVETEGGGAFGVEVIDLADGDIRGA